MQWRFQYTGMVFSNKKVLTHLVMSLVLMSCIQHPVDSTPYSWCSWGVSNGRVHPSSVTISRAVNRLIVLIDETNILAAITKTRITNEMNVNARLLDEHTEQLLDDSYLIKRMTSYDDDRISSLKAILEMYASSLATMAIQQDALSRKASISNDIRTLLCHMEQLYHAIGGTNLDTITNPELSILWRLRFESGLTQIKEYAIATSLQKVLSNFKDDIRGIFQNGLL